MSLLQSAQEKYEYRQVRQYEINSTMKIFGMEKYEIVHVWNFTFIVVWLAQALRASSLLQAILPNL